MFIILPEPVVFTLHFRFAPLDIFQGYLIKSTDIQFPFLNQQKQKTKGGKITKKKLIKKMKQIHLFDSTYLMFNFCSIFFVLPFFRVIIVKQLDTFNNIFNAFTKKKKKKHIQI